MGRVDMEKIHGNRTGTKKIHRDGNILFYYRLPEQMPHPLPRFASPLMVTIATRCHAAFLLWRHLWIRNAASTCY